MSLQPQAALEAATAAAIRSGLGYTTRTCARMLNGQPPPLAPLAFVAVWHDGSRQQTSTRTSLDEAQGVYVTVTVLTVQPFDRWLVHRDDLERRLNAIRELIHNNVYDYYLSRAAGVLAGYDQNPSQPIGFREALAYLGFDRVEEHGPDWLNAAPDSGKTSLSQTVRFGRSRRIQATLTAT